MAENVLFNIAGGIMSSVAGPLAAEEVKLFLGVKKELKKLENTVSTINAVLLDAEEQGAKSHFANNWLGRLTDILYEADDLLDAVSTNALQRELMAGDKMAKKVRLFFSKSNPLIHDHRMAHKIKVIREALDATAVDMRTFNFVPRLEETAVRVRGRDSTNSVMPEYEVVGRDDDKMKIIEQLVDTNVQENVSVLPIVGIGGLGKTTLAQQAYNAEKIKTHFELRMWICVSDPFNVEDIVGKLLESVKGEKANSMDVMINNLKEIIDGKKYLLVLDDVWNENLEQWSRLKRVLVGGATGSKILVTTRSEKVAKIMFQGEPYFLKGLGDEESLILFKHMAFPNGEWPENPKFQELGKEILRKCAGVPLALRTLGRMLHLRNSEVEWLNFVKNDLPKIEKDEYDILSTLKLSYNKLPSYLKHCFAYYSMYPKDYVYNKTTIIKEWISHGFVKASPTNQCLEDVGNNYFMDLLWRSFFQDPKEDKDHVVIGCKMHDLMHDLATLVMTSSLITTSDKKEWNINEKIHHLSVCEGLDFSIKELILQCKGGMMRTFLCPNFKGEIDCETIFSNFKFLRVLNLRGNNLEHLPNTIGQLKHLRYLDLSRNWNIKVLPRACSKLVNLQFLNLAYCIALKGLPRGIKNLVNLKSLDLKGCSKMTYLPYGLRKPTSLQWLKKFRIDLDCASSNNASLSEFKELNKLGGSLIIWNLRHSKDVAAEYKAANIKEKTCLKSLKLHFLSSDEDHNNDFEDERIFEGLQPHANLMELEMDSCQSVRLPSWILSITSLVKLRLFGCKSCKYLPHVNQLHFLKELYLKKMNDLAYISHCSEFSSSSSTSTEISFHFLSEIMFLDCPKLKGWLGDSSLMVDRDNGPCTLPLFPQLSKVLIQNCPQLTSLPLSPQSCLLKEVSLTRIDVVEYVFNDNWSDSLASIEALCPLLSKIQITSCSKLKGWWRDFSLEVNRTLPLFPKLSNIDITNCPLLTYLPLSPHVENLKLVTCSGKILEQIMMVKMLAGTTNSTLVGSSYAPLSKLKEIKLFKLSDLETLQEEWLKYLTSLKELYIYDCSKLKSLSLGIQHFIALENLSITNCVELEPLSDERGKCWVGLKSLLNLRVQNLSKWVSLPLGLQQVNTLQQLRILDCENLTTILESIHHWKSLKHITIQNCPHLIKLPEGIQSLSSLQDLEISKCSKLKSLPPEIQHLTALERLTIGNCPELEPLSHERGKCWVGLKSLLYLRVKNLLKWVSLPLGLQQVSTLQQLQILDCENLTTILESIHHWKSLKEVTIQNCPDLIELPEGIQSLSSLQDLKILKCSKLKSLPPEIQHLTALKRLTIGNCPELEPCSDECGKCWVGLKSLLYLRVENLSKWVSLPLGLQQVSTLQQLQILDCENLTTILESIHHWKSLKEVTIRNCPNLIELPKGIQSLSSLQDLEISECSILKSLPLEIQHLTALKSLTIGNCSELNPPSDECGMGWERLKSLLLLRVENLSKWGSLPSGLQKVGTLRALYISECESLTTILESIHHWKSLEILRISNCPRLTALPEGIQSLSSLRKLLISACPILLQKYKKDGGVNWSKIAHIPELELDCSSSEEANFANELYRMKWLCLQ